MLLQFELNTAMLTVSGLISIDDHAEMAHNICPGMWSRYPEHGHTWDAAGKEMLGGNFNSLSLIYTAVSLVQSMSIRVWCLHLASMGATTYCSTSCGEDLPLWSCHQSAAKQTLGSAYCAAWRRLSDLLQGIYHAWYRVHHGSCSMHHGAAPSRIAARLWPPCLLSVPR